MQTVREAGKKADRKTGKEERRMLGSTEARKQHCILGVGEMHFSQQIKLQMKRMS